MRIISPAIKGYIKLRWSAIDNFLLNPIDTQKMTFNALISSGQYTAIGKEYDFMHVNGIKDYKRAVPVHEYEDLLPYIQRMLEGEQNVLWSSHINWFAKSSGTTSEKSKFIPVSNESLYDCHIKSGKDVLALYYRNFPQSKVLGGKSLVLGGSHQVNQLNADSYYGDLSAVLLQNLNYWQQLIRTPDLSIALMDEWEEKIERMASTTINEDVTSLAGVPTWTMVLLNRIREKTGEEDIHRIWPNLELYVHGGVNFDPYRNQFSKFFPRKKITYLETYNASEGFFSAQDIMGRKGMLLFLNHGIFYEFMPIEEEGKRFPVTLGLAEVEVGKQYAMIISTNSGLWRYKVGDTIEFISVNPYRIRVTGRLKHFINAFGEELIIDNAEQAITKTALKLNLQINDYTGAPIYFNEEHNGAHEWLIECDHHDKIDQNVFIETFDAELQLVNSDYEAKRHKDIALGPPRIHFLRPGTFNEWLKSKNKLGGQHKVPRLSNDRKIIDEILAFLKAGNFVT